MDEARYQIATVARAAGVEAGTLKSWLARATDDNVMGLLAPDHVAPAQPGLSRDAARLFTRRHVYRAAVLGALSNFGMTAAKAMPHAVRVCDLGLTDRTQNCRFSKGETYLAITGNDASAVLNFDNSTTTDEVLHPVFPGAASGATLLLDVGRLFNRVDAVLEALT